MISRLWIVLVAAGCAAAQNSVQIRLLATTDLHGNIYPYDYYLAKPAARGLAKIATLIAQERAANPNTLLLDCGDTIQGSPLESVHQAAVRDAKSGALPPDPMMLAMNRLRYDAMAVGNHEFNYGLKNLEAARKEASFPWLAANVERGGIPGHIIKEVGGVKIAIIGVTTPTIPAWEREENYGNRAFNDPVEAVKRELRGLQADVVIVIAHTGLDRDPKTGVVRPQELANENRAYQIASEVPGIDAVIFGHTHSELVEYRVGGVLMMQPRNWGMSLGEMDITVENHKVISKTSRVIPVTDATVADPAILAIGKPYHDAAEKYLSKPVATAPVAMSSALARVEDNPLIDAIQIAQLDATKADVSLASAFDLKVRIPQGKMSVRQIAALYPYDNTLYTIEGTGRMLRLALENSARFYNTCPTDCSTGPLINKDWIGYNYDLAQGVSYQIDIRKPVGQRIVNLMWHGQPLADDQKLKLAVNNYRAGGSAGYTMFREGKIVWRSTEEVREMMVRYFTQKGSLPAQADGNWRVEPEAAREELRREMR